MPRIPLQDEQTRLQVTSPVPIASTAQARVQGEGIATFGRDLIKTADNLGDYFAVKNKEQEKILLDHVENEAVAAAQKARVTAFQTAKDDGSDQLDIYTKTYTDQLATVTQKLGIGDGDLSQKAQNIIDKVKNSQSDNVYADVIKRGPGALDRQRRDGYISRTQNVRSSPEGAVEAIQKNDAVLDSLSMLYSAPMREKQREEDRQGLVNNAVDGYLEQGRFNEARKALSGDLGKYVIGDQNLEQLQTKVAKAEIDRTNTIFQDQERARRTQKEALADASATNEADVFSSVVNAKTPQERTDALNKGKLLLSQNQLSPQGWNAIQAEAQDTSKTLEDQAKVNYTARIVRGEGSRTLVPEILKDFKNGVLRSDTADTLMKAAKTAARENQSNPAYQRDMSASNKLISTTIIPTANILGTPRLTPEQAQQTSETIILRNSYIDRGMNPVDATRKALQKIVPPTSHLESIPGVDSRLLQEGKFQEAAKQIADQEEQIKKQYNAGEVKRRYEILQKYEQSYKLHNAKESK